MIYFKKMVFKLIQMYTAAFEHIYNWFLGIYVDRKN